MASDLGLHPYKERFTAPHDVEQYATALNVNVKSAVWLWPLLDYAPTLAPRLVPS